MSTSSFGIKKPLHEQIKPKSRAKQLLDTRYSSNWMLFEHNGFKLPGTEEPREKCGHWSWKGCLNVEAHTKNPGKVFVKHYQWSCYRACCKVCIEKWLAREANSATYRLVKGIERDGGKVVHVVASPPNWLHGKSIQELRTQTYKILRTVGIESGACVFHPARYNEKNNCWYYSPHFHILGRGWIEKTKDLYNKEGWIVKGLGVRNTDGEIFATMHYELTHAGIRKKTNAVTWFGKFSYVKLKIPKQDVDDKTCPDCGRKLVDIELIDDVWGLDRPPPDGVFEGFVVCKRFKTVNVFHKTNPRGKFDYNNRQGIGSIAVKEPCILAKKGMDV